MFLAAAIGAGSRAYHRFRVGSAAGVKADGGSGQRMTPMISTGSAV
jgi:hypothetical protein